MRDSRLRPSKRNFSSEACWSMMKIWSPPRSPSPCCSWPPLPDVLSAAMMKPRLNWPITRIREKKDWSNLRPTELRSSDWPAVETLVPNLATSSRDERLLSPALSDDKEKALGNCRLGALGAEAWAAPCAAARWRRLPTAALSCAKETVARTVGPMASGRGMCDTSGTTIPCSSTSMGTNALPASGTASAATTAAAPMLAAGGCSGGSCRGGSGGCWSSNWVWNCDCGRGAAGGSGWYSSVSTKPPSSAPPTPAALQSMLATPAPMLDEPASAAHPPDSGPPPTDDGSSSMMRNSGCDGSAPSSSIGWGSPLFRCCKERPQAAAAAGGAALLGPGPGGACSATGLSGGANSSTWKPGRASSARTWPPLWVSPPGSLGLQLLLSFSGVRRLPALACALLLGGSATLGGVASDRRDAGTGAAAAKPAAALPPPVRGLGDSGPDADAPAAPAAPAEALTSAAGPFWRLLMPKSARAGPPPWALGVKRPVSASCTSPRSVSSLCRKTVRLSGVTLTSTRSCLAVKERMTTGHILELYWWYVSLMSLAMRLGGSIGRRLTK
mmetsp:Transcript_54269/g.145276  ORF Transcript_54269/g.145276 Transcript_54269/m.145276 type:complete len:556 (+) Transcript_54269:579-2246(+)